MKNSIVKEVIEKTIQELEKSGDIVITTSIQNRISQKLFNAVQEVSPNMLTPQELGGILNAINTTVSGVRLDDNDFQTIVGISKEELQDVATKLKCAEW